MPEQAFQVTAAAEGQDALRLRWAIADGYYLYKSKFRFTTQTPGVKLDSPTLPPAETKHDEFFGEVEIYRGQVEVRVPLTRESGAADVLSSGGHLPGVRGRRVVLSAPAPAPDGGAAPGCRPGVRTHRGAGPGKVFSRACRVDRRRGSGAAAPGAGRAPGIGAAIVAARGSGWRMTSSPPRRPSASRRRRAPRIGCNLPGTSPRGPISIGTRWNWPWTAAGDVTLGTFQLPPGEIKKDSILPDGSTGDVEVYHDRVDLTLPLLRGPRAPARGDPGRQVSGLCRDGHLLSAADPAGCPRAAPGAGRAGLPAAPLPRRQPASPAVRAQPAAAPPTRAGLRAGPDRLGPGRREPVGGGRACSSASGSCSPSPPASSP